MSIDFLVKPETVVPLKSLEGLAYILRHRELWPEGFVWNYNDCDQCAMGLAAELFAPELIGQVCTSDIDKMFHVDLSLEEKGIFTELGGIIGKSMNSITPEDVADAIDGMLVKQGKAA